MNYPNRSLYTIKMGLMAILLAAVCQFACLPCAAQNPPEPTREELLNGLHVLLWNRPGETSVLIKLRIHSGATFDMAGKSGMMALLGDALFPDAAAREYFADELGGRLEVTTDYDGIEVTLAGRASEFERIVDLLRTALVNTQLSDEVINKLRESRSKVVRETGIAPSTVADRAIMARLFGEYPYGRPSAGSTETLARVVRPDLMLARERFLNPNNAALVIIGGVEERRAMRALRQLLGMWRKSDSMVPATFRQPEVPDARTLILDQPGAETVEVRLATRGLTRADKDYAAASLLALLARDRWQTALPELGKSAFFVRHEAHALPGSFIMGASVRATDAARALETARGVLRDLYTVPPSAAELAHARAEAIATLNKQAERPESLADAWLDSETFKTGTLGDQARAIGSLTPADLQRVANRLFHDAPAAAVAVGNASQLRAELERTGKVEIAGEAPVVSGKNETQTAPQTGKPAQAPLFAPVKKPLTTTPVKGPIIGPANSPTKKP
jgi:predicted Zn-dependent peptidase